MDKNNQLLKELLIRGISPAEAEQLAYFARKFSYLSTFERSESVKTHFLEKLTRRKEKVIWWPRMFVPAMAFVIVLLVLGAGTVVASQKSLPGEPLYPVKRLSEKVGVIVKPDFEQQIIVRRTEEVRDLVEKKEEPDLVRKTLEDFSQKRKKSDEVNGRFEQSLRNLEEAKEKSSEDERKQIENVLERLDDGHDENGEEVKGEKSQKKGNSEDRSGSNSGED